MSDEPTTPRQAAYMVWCAEGEQSAKKTAEITGISERTIFSWQKNDEWRGRWLSTGAPESELAAAHGKQLMRYAMPVVAKRLLHIVGAETEMRNPVTGTILTNADGSAIMTWASQDRDAVNAAKLLALYALGAPLSQTDVSDGSIFTATYSLPGAPMGSENGGTDPGEQSVAELRRQASAMLEATVASVNTRVSSTQQRRKRI